MLDNVERNETVTFVDEQMGEQVMFSEPDQSFAGQDRNDATLAKFLSRPTLIHTLVWTESEITGDTTIDPWSLFLGKTPIVNKLQNYAFLRGTLHIKVMVNASPFYYGCLMMSYAPYATSVLPFATTDTFPTCGSILMPTSQRPHIMIMPQTCSGGEMKLPFFYAENMVKITSAADVALLGRLAFTTVTALRSANGATTNGCTVQVYAWMDDPVLMGPTVGAALQASEYELNGLVSAPCTALARFAKTLQNVPIIGRYAQATSIGSSAIANIAKLFGWSNPPVINDAMPVMCLPFHGMSSAHISVPRTKFTLDPKAELSVDPRITGIGGEDELAVANFVAHESYVTQGTWETTDAIGVLICNSRVNPMVVDIGTIDATGSYAIQNTPMSLLSDMFRYWRGDIIYRFKVICSKYHKGRVRITWDPISSLTATTDYSNVAYTKIIDLAVSDEIEIRIPYMQAVNWLMTPSRANQWGLGTYKTPSVTSNGTFTVRVLTNLSAPIDTAPVSVLVFARGADNLEFANPMPMSTDASILALQSSDDTSVAPLDRYLVNFGESVHSLRLLLRRSMFVDYFRLRGSSTIAYTDYLGEFRSQQGRFPPAFGYDSTGYCSAKGVTTVGTDYYCNQVRDIPFNRIVSCFVAMRGSTAWTYNISANATNVLTDIKVVRLDDVRETQNGPYYHTLVATSESTQNKFGASWRQIDKDFGQTVGGMLMTNPKTQTGVSVEMPMMSNKRFLLTNPVLRNLGSNHDGSATDTYMLKATVSPASIGVANNTPFLYEFVERYFAIGTDFNCHFFLNAPTVYTNTGLCDSAT